MLQQTTEYNKYGFVNTQTKYLYKKNYYLKLVNNFLIPNNFLFDYIQ